MPILLEQLLNSSQLSQISVVAGRNGISREVVWINTVESLQMIGSVRPSELVFSTGIEFGSDNRALLELVKKCHHAGAACNLISLGQSIKKIPQEAIEYADKNNYPLLTVPTEIRMADLTYMVCDYIMNNRELNKEVKTLFFDLLSQSCDQAETISQLAAHGYTNDLSYGVLVVEESRGGFEKASVIQAVNSKLVFAFYRYYTYEISGKLVYIVVRRNLRNDFRRKSIYEVIKDLNAIFQESEIRIGIGNLYNSLELLSQSFKEALVALRVLAEDQGQKGGCREFYRSELYKMIVKLYDNPILLEFSRNSLTPLEEYDQTNSSHYMDFLRVYLKNDANIQKTSRDLFIHRNTAMYKLNKIEKILGYSLSPIKTKAQLIISLMVKDYF